MSLGFIGIRDGDKHILIALDRIITVEEGAGGAILITYDAGNDLRVYQLIGVSMSDFCNGLASAAASGLSIPKDMMEAIIERAGKEELDS